jgi:hypothetical protein
MFDRRLLDDVGGVDGAIDEDGQRDAANADTRSPFRRRRPVCGYSSHLVCWVSTVPAANRMTHGTEGHFMPGLQHCGALRSGVLIVRQILS